MGWVTIFISQRTLERKLVIAGHKCPRYPCGLTKLTPTFLRLKRRTQPLRGQQCRCRIEGG